MIYYKLIFNTTHKKRLNYIITPTNMKTIIFPNTRKFSLNSFKIGGKKGNEKPLIYKSGGPTNDSDY